MLKARSEADNFLPKDGGLRAEMAKEGCKARKRRPWKTTDRLRPTRGRQSATKPMAAKPKSGRETRRDDKSQDKTEAEVRVE